MSIGFTVSCMASSWITLPKNGVIHKDIHYWAHVADSDGLVLDYRLRECKSPLANSPTRKSPRAEIIMEIGSLPEIDTICANLEQHPRS